MKQTARQLQAMVNRTKKLIERHERQAEKLSERLERLEEKLLKEMTGLKYDSEFTYNGKRYEVFDAHRIRRVDYLGTIANVLYAPRLTEFLKGKADSPFQKKERRKR